MAITLKVTTIGNSTGLILPKEALNMLRVKKGDSLVLTQSSEGMLLTPYDPKFVRTMDAFDRVRRRYRNALRELAK